MILNGFLTMVKHAERDGFIIDLKIFESFLSSAYHVFFPDT